jgi:hypothetical protein
MAYCFQEKAPSDLPADQKGLSAALERMAKERDDLLARAAAVDDDIAECQRIYARFNQQTK